MIVYLSPLCDYLEVRKFDNLENNPIKINEIIKTNDEEKQKILILCRKFKSIFYVPDQKKCMWRNHSSYQNQRRRSYLYKKFQTPLSFKEGNSKPSKEFP